MDFKLFSVLIMSTWGEQLKELQEQAEKDGRFDFDLLRRKHLVGVFQHTRRPVILYATKFTQDANFAPDILSIVDGDLEGIMEVIHGLQGHSLDLILHSPGGSLEAAESMVLYLRSKFDDIRVIVPHMAMSAATMIACGANKIVMGKHSFLGPIDPQIQIATPAGNGVVFRMVPAQAILEQFDQAKKECKDHTNLAAWLPMLGQYGPDLLVQCEHASQLSQELVGDWLQKYMFVNEKDAKTKAKGIAAWLGEHNNFMSHGRHLPRNVLESKGLKIEHLENDQVLQDLVLSVFHAVSHTFNGNPAVGKIIENHMGKAFVRMARQVIVPIPSQQPTPVPSKEQTQEALKTKVLEVARVASKQRTTAKG